MRADDIYRFVGLRQTASFPPADLHDPFIGAYSGNRAAADQGFRARLTAAFGSGDMSTVRSESETLLASAGGGTAWNQLAATSFPKLFLALPALVRRGNVGDAKIAVAKALDVNDFDQIAGTRGEEIGVAREAVADYFAACAVAGAPTADLDGAAHLICCFETLERLVSVAADGEPSPWRESWQIPLRQGIVVLPFEHAPVTRWNSRRDHLIPLGINPS
jgi:hypothetical protein